MVFTSTIPSYTYLISPQNSLYKFVDKWKMGQKSVSSSGISRSCTYHEELAARKQQLKFKIAGAFINAFATNAGMFIGGRVLIG